ncbi:hypothetical protein SFRURICE_020044 [Spodoptera frugiperda]|nr:hypothetical protein SFRURICE_020044 [Spodoptera frugiperda]
MVKKTYLFFMGFWVRFPDRAYIIARSLKLCPVYGNRLIFYYMVLITQIVKMVASATAEQGVSDSIPGSGKVILVLFPIFENFSVVARRLELCLVYGNRLTPYYMGFITQMVKSGSSTESRIVPSILTIGSSPITWDLPITQMVKMVALSLELCPVYGSRLTLLYIGLITQKMVKSGCTLYKRHAVMCTSAYPLGDKKRGVFPTLNMYKTIDCIINDLIIVVNASDPCTFAYPFKDKNNM